MPETGSIAVNEGGCVLVVTEGGYALRMTEGGCALEMTEGGYGCTEVQPVSEFEQTEGGS